MRINKGTQKAILTSLFYERTSQSTAEGMPIFQPKQFAFDKLMDAASSAKKLAEGSTEKDGRIFYTDKEIELTPAEVSVLKELFDANKDKWSVDVAEVVLELKELFDGKK